MFRSQKGQTLIEVAVGILVFVLFTSAICAGLYTIWVKQRLLDLTYEALICEVTREEKFCYQAFRRKVRTQIPFGKVNVRERRRSENLNLWIVDYERKPISFSIQQQVQLPLR